MLSTASNTDSVIDTLPPAYNQALPPESKKSVKALKPFYNSKQHQNRILSTNDNETFQSPDDKTPQTSNDRSSTIVKSSHKNSVTKFIDLRQKIGNHKCTSETPEFRSASVPLTDVHNSRKMSSFSLNSHTGLPTPLIAGLKEPNTEGIKRLIKEPNCFHKNCGTKPGNCKLGLRVDMKNEKPPPCHLPPRLQTSMSHSDHTQTDIDNNFYSNGWLPSEVTPSPSEITQSSSCNQSVCSDPMSGRMDLFDSVILPPTDINGCIQSFDFDKPADNNFSHINRTTQNTQKALSSAECKFSSNVDRKFPDDQKVNAAFWSRKLQESVSRAARKKFIVAGTTLFNMKPNEGLKYLINHGVITNHPGAIAKFITSKNISYQAIGEYFGNLSDPIAVKTAAEFISKMNFVNLELDEALRLMLSKVHPTGESQKIEFLLSLFKENYVRQNTEKVHKYFKDPETINIVAYSILMLHTNMYNASARRLTKQMTCKEFIANNRGIDAGEDISQLFLQGIYERISLAEFKSLPDLNDNLRLIEQNFVGNPKLDNLFQRYRSFVAWTSGYEVHNVTARRPIGSRTTSGLRGLFIFNDILIVGKPSGSLRNNATNELLGISPTDGNFPTPIMTHRRLPSLERLSGHAKINLSGNSSLNGSDISLKNFRKIVGKMPGVCSTHLPGTNCQFHIRNIIPLNNIQVLVFESEFYQSGVQLRDETANILVNINLPTCDIRQKFIDWIYESVEEIKELNKNQYFKTHWTIPSIS